MRTFHATCAALALGIAAGLAGAADYVVVRSSDAAIVKGTALAAGTRVALPTGATLTLVSSGGEVVTLKGSPAGAQVPGVATPGDSAASAALSALVNRPPPRRSFGAMRGSEKCPSAAALQTLEQILAASRESGCGSISQVALEAYIDRAGAASSSDAPAAQP